MCFCSDNTRNAVDSATAITLITHRKISLSIIDSICTPHHLSQRAQGTAAAGLSDRERKGAHRHGDEHKERVAV
jgi:hypothetical protein